jgi:glycerophosphoryl diester phosphodiesterase
MVAVATPWAQQPATKKTLVAHRGASAYAPEHTVQAYTLAMEQGADFVEQDLAVTKDGVLVCIHDLTLERTTNVEEVFPDRAVNVQSGPAPGRHWLVNDFTLAEIKRLDAGSWFDAKFAGARIPTFQEAIDLVRGKAGLFPELKDPEFYRQRGVRPERLFAAALRRTACSATPRRPSSCSRSTTPRCSTRRRTSRRSRACSWSASRTRRGSTRTRR